MTRGDGASGTQDFLSNQPDANGILARNGSSHRRLLRARRVLRDRGVFRVLDLASPRSYTLVDRCWNWKSGAVRRLPDSSGLGLCRQGVRGVWRCLHCQLPPVVVDRGRHPARRVGHSGSAHLPARCGRNPLGSAGVTAKRWGPVQRADEADDARARHGSRRRRGLSPLLDRLGKGSMGLSLRGDNIRII